MNQITAFQGQYRFLSNFWPSLVFIDERTYPTVEHAYQASKTLDENMRHQIAILPQPGQAKKVGRSLKIRPDWNSQTRLSVMEELVRQKFGDKALLIQLLQTGDQELIEGNNWGDQFWGVSLATGTGANHLGKILMRIREEAKVKYR